MGSLLPGSTLSDRPSLSCPHRDKNLATFYDIYYISATVLLGFFLYACPPSFTDLDYGKIPTATTVAAVRTT